MRKAVKLAKKMEGDWKARMALALREVWKEWRGELLKNPKAVIERKYHVVKDDLFVKITLIPKAKPKEKKVINDIRKDVYFAITDLPKGERNIEKLIEENRILKMNGWEFFKLYYTEEEMLYRIYGYDKRTHEYLNAIKKKRGILDYQVGYVEEKFEPIRRLGPYRGLTGDGYISVGKIGDRYVAQYSERCGIDDYCIVRIYFDHLPSKSDIDMAELIDDIELYFKLEPGRYKFVCWECGCERHWLDIRAQNLRERFEMLKERYCGC